MEATLSCMKRVREESEESDESVDSHDVKRLKEDLFNMQDELSPSHDDLDLFIQSFENEVLGCHFSPVPEKVAGGGYSGDSMPELGFLLEASDDELGLPPSRSLEEKGETELVRVTSDSSELSESWGSGYDSFDLGYGDGLCDYGCNDSGEFVTVDGLFDYSDMGFGSGDILLQPKTLPAL